MSTSASMRIFGGGLALAFASHERAVIEHAASGKPTPHQETLKGQAPGRYRSRGASASSVRNRVR